MFLLVTEYGKLLMLEKHGNILDYQILDTFLELEFTLKMLILYMLVLWEICINLRMNVVSTNQLTEEKLGEKYYFLVKMLVLLI